jgi:hypothetical protein
MHKFRDFFSILISPHLLFIGWDGIELEDVHRLGTLDLTLPFHILLPNHCSIRQGRAQYAIWTTIIKEVHKMTDNVANRVRSWPVVTQSLIKRPIVSNIKKLHLVLSLHTDRNFTDRERGGTSIVYAFVIPKYFIYLIML